MGEAWVAAPSTAGAYFDASVWVGRWPFRPPGLGLAALEARLRAEGVSGACVAPLDAVLAPDALPANLALIRAATRRGGFRWVVAAIVDPTLSGWQDGVDRCLAAGARCLKVVPNYHMYPLVAGGRYPGEAPWLPHAAEAGRQGLWGLCRLAAARGLPVAVQMRIQDERSHHPLMRVPGVAAADVAALAAEHPDVRFLACGAYLSDLGGLARAPNVTVEVSLLEGGDTLTDALSRVPAERLVFGSHSPLLYTRAARAKLDAAALPTEARAAVASGNALRLWG